MKLSVKLLERVMNAKWLCEEQPGIHRLLCNGCGEVHRVRIRMEKGQLSIYMLESKIDEIPACEYIGEDVAIPSIFHDAIRSALGQAQASEEMQSEEDGEGGDLDWFDDQLGEILRRMQDEDL